MQPFPIADYEREARIVQDVADLLHEPSPSNETARKIKRWIGHVLSYVARKRRWWFLDNVSSATLAAGADVVDMYGHLDRIIAVYAPQRLNKISLAQITELRQIAQANSRPNAAARCTHYAIEAGRRIHLWPAPSATTPFATLYTRPIDCSLLPDNGWERIVLNGVLGQFGQHFDRDSLSENPAAFEQRFESQLRLETNDSWDIETLLRWSDTSDAVATVTASSATDTGTATLVPASLSGVGYVTIESGDYPLQVA